MNRVAGREGFTLIELLVVIAISAILMAITLSVGRTLLVSNRAADCSSQMRSLGQALRVYYQDWQGVPPRYCNYPVRAAKGLPFNVLDTDENLSGYPGSVNTADDYQIDGPGLMGLVDGEYIHGTNRLHCPVNSEPQSASDPRNPGDPRDPLYAQSYGGRDINARTSGGGLYGQLNQYKYLSTRGVVDPADPDYRRQLCRSIDDGSGHAMPVFDPGWHPADSTVVLWCNWHEDSLQQGAFGQYQVLFWDGSVRRVLNYLFHDVSGQPSGLPTAAWRTRPEGGYTP